MPPLVPKPPSPRLLKQAKMLSVDQIEYTFTPHVLAAAKTRTAKDPETQAINVVYRLYNSHQKYNEKMERQRSAVQQKRKIEEVQECTFNPQIHVSQANCNGARVYQKPFLERQEKWVEKVKKKRKLIEELNQIREETELIFCPQVNSRSKYLAEHNTQRHTFSSVKGDSDNQTGRQSGLTSSKSDSIPYGYTIRERDLRPSTPASISKAGANYMTLADLAEIVEQDQCFGFPEITAKAASLDRKEPVFDRLYDMGKKRRSTSNLAHERTSCSNAHCPRGTRSASTSNQTYDRLYRGYKDMAMKRQKLEEQYYQQLTTGSTAMEKYGIEWVKKRDEMARKAMQRRGIEIFESPQQTHEKENSSFTIGSRPETPCTEHLTRHILVPRGTPHDDHRQSTSVLDMSQLAREAELLDKSGNSSKDEISMSADLTDSQFQLLGYGEELDLELKAMNEAISRSTQRKNILRQSPDFVVPSLDHDRGQNVCKQMNVFKRLAVLSNKKDNETMHSATNSKVQERLGKSGAVSTDNTALLTRMQYFADRARIKQEQLRQEVESKRNEELSFKPNLESSKAGALRYEKKLAGDMYTREEQWLAKKRAKQEKVRMEMLEERICREKREEQQLRDCLERSKSQNLKKLRSAIVGKDADTLIHGSVRAFPRDNDELLAMANQIEKACLVMNGSTPQKSPGTLRSLRRESTFGLTDLLPSSVKEEAGDGSNKLSSPSDSAKDRHAETTLTLLSSIGNGSVMNACNTIDSITTHIARMKKGAELRAEKATGYLNADEWLLSQ